MRYNILSKTAQIFVPYNCGNNCPFCSTRQYYNTLHLNMSKTLNVIRQLNNNDFVDHFTFTGGEPLYNFNYFKALVYNSKLPIYVITSLPLVDNIDEIIEYINNEPKIIDVTISRHIDYEFNVKVGSIDYIKKINKPISINTVITEGFTKEKFLSFINYYEEQLSDKELTINLRHDYRTVTEETLHVQDEYNMMLSELGYNFINTVSCPICNVDIYEYSENRFIRYHKIIENKIIEHEDYEDVYSLIVSPDARICKTFSFETDEEYSNYILKNHYSDKYVIQTKMGYLANNSFNSLLFKGKITDETIWRINKINNDMIKLLDNSDITYKIIDIR